MVDPNDLNRKHIYIQVKKGDVDLNTDDYSSLNGEVYLLTTEGNVQNAQKYSNVKVADPTVVYEFAINPDKSHIIPENVLYWVKFLTEIENNRMKFSACKGIMFDTNMEMPNGISTAFAKMTMLFFIPKEEELLQLDR